VAAPDGSQTSALTGVFAPGSASLTESLRTLVVTPPRTVTPGEIIRVEFAFSNLGGAPATGVRVRFAAPSGVSAVEGSDTLDDAPLEDQRLVAPEGAALGDLEQNAQRRVACSFRVDERIEDATELQFQAALVTDQTPVVGSNRERRIVRSRPLLQNSSTLVTILAPNQPKPGDVLTIQATIVNTGNSSAHDVLAFLPLPAHTSFVPRSARIAGRALVNAPDEPFDYANETVLTGRLGSGQTIVAEYQATIDAPLADGTRVKATGAISSRETEEFTVTSAEIVVRSPADFSGDETALTVFCDDIVSPGTRVPMAVRALNCGTGDAHNLSIAFELPQGLAYTPGSAHLDGQPVSDETFAGSAFSLGTLPAGRIADAGIASIVTTQTPGDLPITAVLRWKGPSTGSGQASERRFTRTLRVRASARFTRARNYIEVDRGVVAAREDVTFTAHVFNDGTAAETDVRLRVIPGAFLEDVRIAESPEEPVTYAEPLALGIVQPHSERIFVVRARIASPVPDRSQITLGAVLEFAAGSFDLGVASIIVRSRPHVAPESCAWERVQSEPLRPGQTHEIAIRFTNDGADVLRDARFELQLPSEIILDRAQNAQREGVNTLRFGDIAAETTHEARVAIRLTRARREPNFALEGTLTGRGISPVQFDALEIATFAQPQFEEGAQLRSYPAESITAGDRVAYEMTLRNSGDGPADHLVIRTVPSNLAVYIPGSTTLNGMVLGDDLGTSQLWSQRGLLLTDVNPTMELRIRWEMLVIAPLAEGTAVDTRAVVEWDGGQSIGLAAPTLQVMSSPSLHAGAAGTPISVASLQPQLETPAPEAIVPPAATEPPRTRPRITTTTQAVQPQPPVLAETATPPEAIAAAAPHLYIEFTHDELTQAVRTLEKSDAGGLIPHIFAIRALFPAAISGADARLAQTVENAARAIRAPLDRFFVRLRVPRLAITAKDLEDRDSRFALRALVAAVIDAPATALSTRPQGVVRVSGGADVESLRRRLPELEQMPLGCVVPWIVNAQLLGERIEYNGGQTSNVLGLYRAELVKVFSVLETLPMPEFHRVLSSSVNRTLDDALGAVLDALRGAAHIGVS
jgi:uncharacterized repeat protein (TIGR01451 family)